MSSQTKTDTAGTIVAGGSLIHAVDYLSEANRCTNEHNYLKYLMIRIFDDRKIKLFSGKAC